MDAKELLEIRIYVQEKERIAQEAFNRVWQAERALEQRKAERDSARYDADECTRDLKKIEEAILNGEEPERPWWFS